MTLARTPFLIMTTLSLLLLAACGTAESEAKYPTGAERTGADQNAVYDEPESIFGKGGVMGTVLGRDEDGEKYSGADGIGVNSYLWRASLDTVSFMPLASADPFGGVILTDWYSPPDAGDERFKLNVFILDRQLRSDGVQVKVFRQLKKGGAWKDADASPETGRQLEDAILTRARKMRVAQMGKIDE